jgi:hypothetical protein
VGNSGACGGCGEGHEEFIPMWPVRGDQGLEAWKEFQNQAVPPNCFLPGCGITLNIQKKEVLSMATLIDRKTAEKEAEEIEKLAGEAEILLGEADAKKDLKEKRGLIKQTLYDGSNKLKHIIPKGKHL